MLTEVLLALFAGGAVAVLAKLGSRRRSRGAFVLVALLGGFGGIVGLFFGRVTGLSRDLPATLFVIAATFGLAATVVYGLLSRMVVRRAERRGSRSSLGF